MAGSGNGGSDGRLLAMERRCSSGSADSLRWRSNASAALGDGKAMAQGELTPRETQWSRVSLAQPGESHVGC